MVEEVFRRQYAQLKYSDTTERKVEIRDADSMEAFTAETPAHIDALVNNLVNTSVELSQKSTRNGPALRAELAGELKEKLRDATRSGIEELIVG